MLYIIIYYIKLKIFQNEIKFKKKRKEKRKSHTNTVQSG